MENIVKCVVIKSNNVIVKKQLLKYTYGLNARNNRRFKIIVSLASFPERFSTLHICLNSLLHQTMKPNRIIVWLDDSVDEKQFTLEMVAFKSKR